MGACRVGDSYPTAAAPADLRVPFPWRQVPTIAYGSVKFRNRKPVAVNHAAVSLGARCRTPRFALPGPWSPPSGMSVRRLSPPRPVVTSEHLRHQADGRSERHGARVRGPRVLGTAIRMRRRQAARRFPGARRSVRAETKNTGCVYGVQCGLRLRRLLGVLGCTLPREAAFRLPPR